MPEVTPLASLAAPPQSFTFADVWCAHGPVFAVVVADGVTAPPSLDGVDTFSAPVTWRLEQVARALGMFKSASEAKRNGWSGPLVTGLRKFRGASHEFRSVRRDAGLIVLAEVS